MDDVHIVASDENYQLMNVAFNMRHNYNNIN